MFIIQILQVSFCKYRHLRIPFSIVAIKNLNRVRSKDLVDQAALLQFDPKLICLNDF